MLDPLLLSDAIRIKHGFAFPGADFSDDPSFPTLVTPGNFAVGGGFKVAKTKTFAGYVPAEYELQPHDLIVTMTDLSKEGDTLGLPAFVPDDGLFLHNQRIGLVEIHNGALVDKRFLGFLLRTNVYRSYILGTASGSTVRHTSPSRICSFIATVPALTEQAAIAELLGSLDDKIAANVSTINIADDLVMSLARAALDYTSLRDLSSIALVTMGSSPVGPSLNESQEGIVFYQGIRDFGVRYPTNRIWTTAPVRLAKPFDSLLSVRAPVGSVNLASQETCIGRGLASVRSRDDRPYSLFHLLKAIPEAWMPFEAEGTVFGSINRGQLESLLVPSLHPKNAAELELQLGSLERRISSSLEENTLLTATRDALLPQLMSGTLRVKDAEKVLEEAGV